MHADLKSIVCKFGGDPAICLREEAICAKVYRQTDGRRTPRHCIAHSWNELKMNVFSPGCLCVLFIVATIQWGIQIIKNGPIYTIASRTTGSGTMNTRTGSGAAGEVRRQNGADAKLEDRFDDVIGLRR